MKIAVIVFPGTNCELDVVHALTALTADPQLVWHQETSLAGFDGAVLPGGFAHGDYLRTGAIARFSPVMSEVVRMARSGAPVIGICNGFQILCESGLLPGALIANRDLRFICKYIHLRIENSTSALTNAGEAGHVLRIPLNSYGGNWIAGSEELVHVEENNQVILRYSDELGAVTERTNPNGSTNSIAGLSNEAGNVAGLMPHPERASDPLLGSTDGLVLFRSFLAAVPALT